MAATFDIAVRRARLRGNSASLMEIAIRDGHIAAIGQRLDGEAITEIDAAGNLITELFVNPHLHLCKVFTLPMMEEEALKAYRGNGMAGAMAAIELASVIKEKYAEFLDRRQRPARGGAGGAPRHAPHPRLRRCRRQGPA